MRISLRLKIICTMFCFITVFSIVARTVFVQIIPTNYFRNNIENIVRDIEKILNNSYLDDNQQYIDIKELVKTEPFIDILTLEDVPAPIGDPDVEEYNNKSIKVMHSNQLFGKTLTWTSDANNYATIKVACDIALNYTITFLIIFSIIFAFIVSKSVLEKSNKISTILDDIVDGKEILPIKKDIVEDELDELIDKVNNLNSIYSKNLGDLRREKLYKKQLMLSLSHEIKTPIGGINGILEGMLDGVPPYTNRDKYIRECRKLSARLGQITNEMLDVTKMDSLITDREEIFITLLLEEIVDGLNPIILSKNLRVVLDVDVRISIFTDKRLFKRALINIIENAIKYCSFGGLIEITNTGFILNVYNEGQALTSDDLYLIFNPLFRGSNKKNVSGKGLGLYIVKECFTALNLPHKIDNHKNGVIFKIYLDGGNYES